MSQPWETYQAGRNVRLRRRPVRYHAGESQPAPAPADTEITPDYASMKKDELVAEAEEQGLDSSGTKAEIIERLTSHE